MTGIPTARPPLAATNPDFPVPPGACDTHVHVFAGQGEFPRDPMRAEDPAAGDLMHWCGMLRHRMHGLGIARAVLVHSVIYREDCAATCAALKVLGGAFRGIALVQPDISDAELDILHDAGFRGVRVDLVFPGALCVADLPALLPRLAARGWHVQVFGKWAQHADVILDIVRAAPCPVVLDHLAYVTQAPAHDDLYRAMDRGKLWVKLSSLYRQDPQAVVTVVDDLVAKHPDRLLWGSNWPHVRWDGDLPNEAGLIGQVAHRLSSRDRLQIFTKNAEALYGFDA